MKDRDWHVLEELCALHGVSGREDRVISYLKDKLDPLVDEVHVDRIGNVVGVLQGSEHPECKLMLQAHMDELGLIVRNISEDGYVLVERVGGLPEKSLLGQQVDILTDDDQLVSGYVGTKSHHITGSEEKFKVPKVHDMYVDLGVKDRQAVEEIGVKVGDPITYTPNFNRFGDGMICSKALDNRVGVFVLLEVLRSLSKNRPSCTVVFSFTVLEEFSIRGSLPTVNRWDPDAILSVDITIACDTPDAPPLHPVRVRNGPAIKMMDFHGRGTLGGMFSAPKLRRFIEKEAKKVQIPLQREVIVGVITDPAFQLYLGQDGYVIAGLSIPQRYSHASIQMCHENDISMLIDLIDSVSLSFKPDLDLTRGS